MHSTMTSNSLIIALGQDQSDHGTRGVFLITIDDLRLYKAEDWLGSVGFGLTGSSSFGTRPRPIYGPRLPSPAHPRSGYGEM